jgi:hypothetical protein
MYKCKLCGNPVKYEHTICDECETKTTDCWDCVHAIVKWYPHTQWEPEDYEMKGCTEGLKVESEWICKSFEKGKNQDYDERTLDED